MNKRFASVWDAIEDGPAQRENMKVRSALMTVLTDFIVAEGMTQAQAAEKFGVSQPRISDLMRGKINLFAIDTLVNMIGAAGLHMEMQIGKAA
jgi:predicted XRE-type DNA-binding protein